MAKFGVKVAWMALPALLFILSAIAMKAYPLAGKEWEKMKRNRAGSMKPGGNSNFDNEWMI